MEILALLSTREDVFIAGLKKALAKYTVYPLKTLDELEDLYSNIPLNFIILDTGSFRLDGLMGFLRKLDDGMVMLITPGRPGDDFNMYDLPASVCGAVDAESVLTALPDKLKHALEKQKYKSEIRFMKKSVNQSRPSHDRTYRRHEAEMFSGHFEPAPYGRFIKEKVVVNFAKMLTASFDMRKLFDHFMDSVMEIARVSRMSVLLKDTDGFRVKTCNGLDPYIADNILLQRDSELISMLARTGRIIQKPVSFEKPADLSIAKEMDLLQCAVSFPMIYKGKLIGIFNIGEKIAEESYYREELELIYVLCNYLAAAVKDIDLHHQMWCQKEFTKNILASMTSGMIAIDKSRKVTILNQQASEILGIGQREAEGADLNVLPSPLGEILYETMSTGRSYNRHEVVIRPSGMILGINSYRLLDEQQNASGAGILFSDLSDSKKLEGEKRKAEKLKTVNDLMAKIAHEVRNPLTSIHTYTQLLHEKQSDDDLSRFYTATVTESISRLDGLIDKLVTFSSTQDYHLIREDLNTLLDLVYGEAFKNLPATHELMKHSMQGNCYINADKKYLVKALCYIVQSIISRTPGGTAVIIEAGLPAGTVPSVEILISYTGGEDLADTKNELLNSLFDIRDLGADLNLPISNKIIEGHNGTLDIRSAEGINTFVIDLPLLEESSASERFEGGRISGTQ